LCRVKDRRGWRGGFGPGLCRACCRLRRGRDRGQDVCACFALCRRRCGRLCRLVAAFFSGAFLNSAFFSIAFFGRVFFCAALTLCRWGLVGRHRGGHCRGCRRFGCFGSVVGRRVGAGRKQRQHDQHHHGCCPQPCDLTMHEQLVLCVTL